MGDILPLITLSPLRGSVCAETPGVRCIFKLKKYSAVISNFSKLRNFAHTILLSTVLFHPRQPLGLIQVLVVSPFVQSIRRLILRGVMNSSSE
jgi:hypothetical protein